MTAKLIKREDGLYFLNDNLGNLVYGKLSKKNCQEIEQQFPNEKMWDVEIDEEMEFFFDPAMGITQGHYLDKPKLDVDGCLILKLKSE